MVMMMMTPAAFICMGNNIWNM